MKTKNAKTKKTTKPVHVEKLGNVRVPVYRVRTAGGYVSYQVADYTGGRRRFVTRTDLSDAKAEAERISKALANADTAALQLTSADRGRFVASLKNLEPTGIPLEVATATYAKTFEVLGGDRVLEAGRFFAEHLKRELPRKSILEVAAELLKVRAKVTKRGRPGSPRYIQDLRARLAKLAEGLRKPLAEVTQADLQLWLDGVEGAPQTRKNFQTVAHTLFEFAFARGYVLANPAARLEKIRPAVGDAEFYTSTELRRLLVAASPEILPCLALGALAGLRSSEVERLPWQAIDLKRRSIRLTRELTKTTRHRNVPVCEALAEWLTPYADRTGLVWTGAHEAYYEAQSETARKASVQTDATGKPLPALAWRDNGLRRSFATHRLAQTGNLGIVATELGNSKDVALEHYAGLVSPEEAEAFFAVKPTGASNVLPFASAHSAG